VIALKNNCVAWAVLNYFACRYYNFLARKCRVLVQSRNRCWCIELLLWPERGKPQQNVSNAFQTPFYFAENWFRLDYFDNIWANLRNIYLIPWEWFS